MSSAEVSANYERILAEWRLSPVDTGEDQPWTGPRSPSSLPNQGFKIHLSATILSGGDLLEQVLPWLFDSGVHFKVASSIRSVRLLNRGHYGYPQIGKTLVAYFADIESFHSGLEECAKRTHGIPGPRVPSDRRYKSTNVHYRYGSFDSRRPYLTNPSNNERIEDKRTWQTAVPEWAETPITRQDAKCAAGQQSSASVLRSRGILVTRPIRQRGKSAVFEGRMLDRAEKKSRRISIKQGYRYGETELSGVDGYLRTEWQHQVLQKFSPELPSVAQAHMGIATKSDFFLVMEYLNPPTLAWLLRDGRRFSGAEIQSITGHLARILQSFRKDGYFINDLTPDNVHVADDLSLRIADLEFVSGPNSPPPIRGGSPGFYLDNHQSGQLRDNYALASTVYAMSNPEWFEAQMSSIRSVEKSELDRGVLPEHLRIVIMDAVHGQTDESTADDWLARLSLSAGPNPVVRL